MQSTEETKRKQPEEDYVKQALEEVTALEQGFRKVENQLMRCDNIEVPSIMLSDKQMEFLNEKPDYMKYLRCVKTFHEGIALTEEKEFKDTKVQVLRGMEVIKNTLKQIHKV